MTRSRISLATISALLTFHSIVVTMAFAFSQTASTQTGVNSFQRFFDTLASSKNSGSSRAEADFSQLVDSLGTMSASEVLAGMQVIDRELDSSAVPEDRLAKADAANLLMFLSWRPDGAELLAPQTQRLAAMLADPTHFLSGPAAIALQHIGFTRPDLVAPILEAALERADVNNETSVGPGVAGILFQISPTDSSAITHVAQYMSRRDLTDKQLVDTIISISNNPRVPEAFAAPLISALDRPSENVKIQVLGAIARGSDSLKKLARARVGRMASDPGETAQVRQKAAEVRLLSSRR